MASGNRAARVKWFLAVVVVAVVVGGGSVAAYGLVVHGNAAALLPWFSSTDSGPSRETHAASGLQTPRPIPVPAPPMAASLPIAQVRPIIFLPGIMGSYLTGGANAELWPDMQGIADDFGCFDGANTAEQVTLLDPLQLTETGAVPPGSTVGVANGIAKPVYASAGTASIGGALTAESYSKDCGPLGIFGILGIFSSCGSNACGSPTYYEATAANAKASGYTVVPSDDSVGLALCSGNPRCFVPVGYDWRLSAEDNAVKVLQIIEQVLTVTRADRVDILAHSQGGLVAQAITRLPQSIGKIYRIVTLGTPFLGAPKALSIVLYRTPCLDSHCALDMGVVQSLAENYPGLAELLPSEAYYDGYGPSASPLVSTPSTGPSPGFTYDQALQVIASQLETLSYPATPRDASLVDAAEQTHQADDLWTPLDPAVGLLRMIGYDANDASPNCDGSGPCNPPIQIAPQGDTITTVVEPSGNQPASALLGDGDGTVPLYSASLYNPATNFDDRGAGRDMYWCGYSHSGLAQSTAVWETAEAYLEGRVSYAVDVLGAACPDGGLGTIASLNLVGASGKQPVGAAPPDATSITSCSPANMATAPAPATITFENNSATDELDLYWYDPSCRETLYATIPPQMELTQMAYIGDVWHIRLHSSGALIGTAIASATPQTITAPVT